MKKYLLGIGISAVAILAFINLSSFKSESKANQYILIEVYEIPKYSDNGVHIHLGNGKSEYIPFKEFKSEHHDDNGDIILQAVNKMSNEGYVVTSTAAGLTQAGMITKIFMEKK